MTLLPCSHIYHEEGRVYYEGGTGRYEFNIRDHLGNTRLTFTDRDNDGTIEITDDAETNEVLQENHYYPFGMAMAGQWMANPGREDKYQYNGKELHDDFGLGWYAYGARFYDPVIGRFTGVDPISNEFPNLSPYNYASNNPSTGIDLHGLQFLDSNVKIALDNKNKRLEVRGKLEINVKIVNLSSKSVEKGAIEYHKNKSSKTFDNLNALSFRTTIPLHPKTGEIVSEEFHVSGQLNIDFTFSSKIEKGLESLKKGDYALLLLDEVNNGELGGRAEFMGNTYAVDIDVFNSMNNTDTHEKGHLLGLDDVKGKNAPKGFLMSYGDDGSGYKLTLTESREIIKTVLDLMSFNAKGSGPKNNNTQKEAEGLRKKVN